MTKLLLLFLLVSNLLVANVYTIKSGKWGDKSVWSTYAVPTKSDSVVVSHNHQISLSLDSNICQNLVVLGTISFSSSNKSLMCNDIFLDENGSINSTVLGTVRTGKLFSNGINNIEGINLQVKDSVIVNGEIKFIRRSGVVSLKTIDIRKNAKWQVEDDRSFEINGNLINRGQFFSGKGKYLFNGIDTLMGDLISIHKMEVKGHLFFQDSVLLVEEVLGLGSAMITCLDSSYLELQTTHSNFKVDYLNLSGNNSTICFSRENNQVIPKVIGGHFENIVVKTQGKLVFNEDLEVSNNIIIHNGSTLVLSNYLIKTKGSNQKIKVFDGGTLFSDNYIGNFQTFLNGFNLKEWGKGSLLKIEDSKSVFLNEFQLGNLEVNLVNESAQLKLVQDSLVVSQNLKLGPNTKFDIADKSIFIGGDWTGGKITNALNSEVYYNGNQAQKIGGFDYSTLKINNSSLDTLVFNGRFNVHKLEVLKGRLKIGSLTLDTVSVDSLGVLLIGGIDPVFNTQILNKGYIGIVSDNVNCTFYANIFNYSEFINQTNSSHNLYGDLFNSGVFIGCEGSGCTWNVLEDLSINGVGFYKIPRLNLMSFKKVINKSNLEISHEISGNGKLINSSNGFLKLGMNDDQIKIEIDAFSYSNNTVVYNGLNTQIIGDLSYGKYWNLIFENNSTKQLKHHIFIENELSILDSVVVNVYDKIITGTIAGSFKMKDNSRLVLGDPKIDYSTPFPEGFLADNCILSDSSTVQYNAWKLQFVNGAIKYGNLYLTDGIGTENKKLVVNSDSLVVNGNLELGESSVKLLLGDKYLRVNGDCFGAGSINADNALIEFHGNCSGKGEYQLGTSKVVYKGVGVQEAKNCNYFDVEIQKPSGSVNINAGPAEFVVLGELNVNKGVLIVNGEKVNITGRTFINDKIVFASKIQEKRFNDILVSENGFLDNQYGVNISCEGNIINKGIWRCKGGVLTMENANKNQTLLNQGEMILNALNIDKSGFSLQLEGNVSFLDTLRLINSDITLNESKVFLDKKSCLVGESDSNQVTGFESEFSHYLSLDTLNYKNIAGLGIELKAKYLIKNILIKRFFRKFNLNGESSTNNHGYEIVLDSLASKTAAIVFKINYFKYWFLPDYVNDYTVYFGGENTGYEIIASQLDVSKNEIYGKVNHSGEIVFSKQDLTVLPVHLIDFYATGEKNGVTLNWHVGTEWGVKEYRVVKNEFNTADVLLSVVNASNSGFQENFYEAFDSKKSTTCYYILYECNLNNDCKELKKIYFDSRTNHIKDEIYSEFELKKFLNNMQENDWIHFYSLSGQLLFKVQRGDRYPALKQGVFLVQFSKSHKKGWLKIMR